MPRNVSKRALPVVHTTAQFPPSNGSDGCGGKPFHVACAERFPIVGLQPGFLKETLHNAAWANVVRSETWHRHIPHCDPSGPKG